MKALLVNPEYPPTYWSYRHSLRFVGKRCALPPLGLLTVAALLPRHWRPALVDLNVEPLDDRRLRACDVVMLTGMHCQRRSLHALLDRCRRLGVPTVVGGPYATTEPHLLEQADHLVLGEAEDTLGGFCADLEAGRAARVTRNVDLPDVTRSPVPRFDLLRRDVYYNMSLQYSRGCPFACEFCDIIVVFGRRPRTKTVAQVEAELEAIAATRFRGGVFFVDDNFIGNRRAVRALLPRVEAWQVRRGWPFAFYTEATLNLAEDPALMAAMTRAGFWSVFIGIESPSAASLEETRKTQNARGDMVARVGAVLRQGLDVWGGFIIGFDSDGPDIFEQQLEFIERAAIPDAMVGLLQAIPGTPLSTRLAAAGRLRTIESTDQFGRTNFETMLPEPVLVRGYRHTLGTLYEPRRYFGRVLAMMRRRPPGRGGRLRPADLLAGARAVVAQGVRGSYRGAYWRFLVDVWRWDRSRLPEAIRRAAAGHHFIEYTRREALPRLADALRDLPAAVEGAPEREPDAQNRAGEREGVADPAVDGEAIARLHGAGDGAARERWRLGQQAPFGVDDRRRPRRRGPDDPAPLLDGAHAHQIERLGGELGIGEPGVVAQVHEVAGALPDPARHDLGEHRLVADHHARRAGDGR
jgi:radical SAM superfamily enzyme YgiQ (UPF0313 family)